MQPIRVSLVSLGCGATSSSSEPFLGRSLFGRLRPGRKLPQVLRQRFLDPEQLLRHPSKHLARVELRMSSHPLAEAVLGRVREQRRGIVESRRHINSGLSEWVRRKEGRILPCRQPAILADARRTNSSMSVAKDSGGRTKN